MKKMIFKNGDGPYDFSCGNRETVSAEVRAFTEQDSQRGKRIVILLTDGSENQTPSLSIRIPEVARQCCKAVGIDNPADPSITIVHHKPSFRGEPETFRHDALEHRQDGILSGDGRRSRSLSRDEVSRLIGPENMPPEPAQQQPDSRQYDLSEESVTGQASIPEPERKQYHPDPEPDLTPEY